MSGTQPGAGSTTSTQRWVTEPATLVAIRAMLYWPGGFRRVPEMVAVP